LLNDIVAAQAATGVDIVSEINELARIANAIQTIAAGGTASPALTEMDLALIGMSGVTPDNLGAVLATIAGQAHDGSQTDELTELQSLVDNLNVALGTLSSFAQNNISGVAQATGTAPAAATSAMPRARAAVTQGSDSVAPTAAVLWRA
jgi:hypothetical protein